MNLIDCGTSGVDLTGNTVNWEDLELEDYWTEIIEILVPGTCPRPAQISALKDHAILDGRKNIILSSPTNSGKSLIGLLIVLEAVLEGKRGLILEPLRAIAREKANELQRILPQLKEITGKDISVRITTGDYRLEEEDYSSPPPEGGEIIIATPERFDSILRNSKNDQWIDSIGAVCVDEAHMVSSKRRGSTLEFIITFLLTRKVPPRIILLSATIGNVEKAQEWLNPCDVICISDRCPPLQKMLISVGEEEQANDVVTELVPDILSNPESNILVFVYQTRSAESLADLLQDNLSASYPNVSCLAYHSKMDSGQRRSVIESFMQGNCRVLVTTTALGLGVNLPATHVIIRDTTFVGFGELGVDEILQMMGRAGRGNNPGIAYVMIRPNDKWSVAELSHQLREEILPDFISNFEIQERASREYWGQDKDQGLIERTASHVAALLCRISKEGMSFAEITVFFERSLGGKYFIQHLDKSLRFLERNSLAYVDEWSKWHLTVLGEKSTLKMLPLTMASGLASLFRDIMSVDTLGNILREWTELDTLIVLHLLFDELPKPRRFSKALSGQVHSWIERVGSPKSILYREWLQGEKDNSKADQVIGSLRINFEGSQVQRAEKARKAGYMVLFQSIILYERGSGKNSEELERTWRIKSLNGLEERWRDTAMWLLSGIAALCDIRCFYFHLKEKCEADPDRVKQTKLLLRQIHRTCYSLQDKLKYCSALGPFVMALRKSLRDYSGAKVGPQTIKKLEENGIRSPRDLRGISYNKLVEMGIRKDFAKQVSGYIKRRLQ